MSALIVSLIGLLLGFVLIFLGMPIGLAFGTMGVIGLWYLKGFGPTLNVLATTPFTTMMQYLWTVMPMFIFMGFLAERTELAKEFFSGVSKWIGHFRGGLATAIVVGNAAFGACTGEPLSAGVTFTKIALPETRKYNYADSLTLGSIAAGCQLVGLIPPSLPFIVYAGITGTSVGKLFIAGILPGLLLTGFYIGVIFILCLLNPALGPAGPKASFREKIKGTLGMWALVIMFTVIIGGFYLGLFSPTEIGAVAAFVVMLIGLARRRLSLQTFRSALIDAGKTTAMIGLLVVGCTVFNRFLTMSGSAPIIAEFITEITGTPLSFSALVLVVFAILGCFIDVMSLVLLSLPILFPVAISLGVDPVHFGVLIILASALGVTTPPFGVICFALAGVANVKLYTVFRGAAPFFSAMIICALLVLFFPQIALLLPNMMGR